MEWVLSLTSPYHVASQREQFEDKDYIALTESSIYVTCNSAIDRRPVAGCGKVTIPCHRSPDNQALNYNVLDVVIHVSGLPYSILSAERLLRAGDLILEGDRDQVVLKNPSDPCCYAERINRIYRLSMPTNPKDSIFQNVEPVIFSFNMSDEDQQEMSKIRKGKVRANRESEDVHGASQEEIRHDRQMGDHRYEENGSQVPANSNEQSNALSTRTRLEAAQSNTREQLPGNRQATSHPTMRSRPTQQDGEKSVRPDQLRSRKLNNTLKSRYKTLLHLDVLVARR